MTSNKLKRALLNETGQMSIFVALMFQVLFVFFAMVINIGLIVHDKINLQNSVDLAAYYGAQRQAELLNEIGHINYQIRQDFKLLTWRYRVLGMLGRTGDEKLARPHPARPNPSPVAPPPPPDAPLPRWIPYSGPDPSGAEETPVVCAAHYLWKEFGTSSTKKENYCWQPYGSTTPAIPKAPTGASFLGINNFIVGYVDQARKMQAASCDNAAPLNWAFTMQMLYAYRLSIAVKKMEIWSLRKALIQKGDILKDINGQSVKDGVLNTLQKNLTQANEDSLNPADVKFVNGLELGPCGADASSNTAGEMVLPEVRIAPFLWYMRSFTNGGLCNYEMRPHTQVTGLIDPTALEAWDPAGLMRKLANGEPEKDDPLHSSLGFEKNPWCMAYVGVSAKTKPRKPFAPFGPNIELQARAFAQPFGGRVGPWYNEVWPNGAPFSNQDENGRIDPLTPKRLLPGATIDYNNSLPNYSRYPGDKLGLGSQLAMGAQRHILGKLDRPGSMLSLAWFTGFSGIPVTGDPLMWDPLVDPNADPDKHPFAQYRLAELAGIAPDLFDTTYYSIDPAAASTYYKAHNDHPERFTEFKPIYGQATKPAPDLGGRNDAPALRPFEVQNQISRTVKDGTDPTVLPNLYYLIRDWKHLLTGWVQSGANKYETFPDKRFGDCAEPANVAVAPIPGLCASGGRVGYSVRLISRDHLMSPKLNLGGPGQNGPILNPPTGF